MNWQQACNLPYYGGDDLGATWQPEKTAFALWAPTATTVRVEFFAAGTDNEPGAAHLGSHAMTRSADGVWRFTRAGDCHGVYYLYHLQFSDGHTADAVDPYARTTGANGRRAMVLDPNRAAPEGWHNDRRPCIPTSETVVWEVHVADFSADEHCGVPAAWRGKYLGFTPENTTLNGDGVHPTCLNYLKRLGISHVQLQPIFDYATVDETCPGRDYNWGYDPLNYNTPEGSFATDPYHGEVRVRELRAMVAALHRAGLGVVMDVVYNHTYHSDSWLERTVPGYWNRRTPDGRMTNGSGCGCDLASERPMVRKYLVDSVLYWAKTYHLDGFRFDAGSAGFVNGAPPCGLNVLYAANAWRGGEHGFTPKRAMQVVQYVSAHDNYTLWDKLAAVARRTDYDTPAPDLLAQNRMAAGICLTVCGMPFLQAGEEFARTKHGEPNSYRGPLTTNLLDWQRAYTLEFYDLTQYYAGLFALRRAFPELSGDTTTEPAYILPLPGWLIGFVPQGGRLAVYYNPERTRQWVALPAGRWRTLVNSRTAGTVPFGPHYRNALELAPTSVTVMVREEQR